MAIYSFETITAAEALAITPLDSLTFASGSARDMTVLFVTGPPASVTLIQGAYAVTFGAAITAVSSTSQISFPDNSILFLGSPVGDSPPSGGVQNDAYFGADGNDSLSSGDGANLLQGNAGNDLLTGGAGPDTVYGGQDNDFINTGNGVNFAQGNKGNDEIIGGLDPDTLLGGQGNDQIFGFAGRDVLNGNLGDDQVSGEGLLLGEGGNDTLLGKSDFDSISGGDGNDRITGVGGFFDAGTGADTVNCANGVGADTTVLGGDGDDIIDAHFGSSALHMNLSGDAGNDSIVGSSGSDTISGGSGDDTLSGASAIADRADILSGGSGRDLFIARSLIIDATNSKPLSTASIVDWEVGDSYRSGIAGAGPGTSINYTEISAADYDAAYSAARALAMAQSALHYVSVQVGPDVVLFTFSPNLFTDAVRLTGRSLADIDFGNIV